MMNRIKYGMTLLLSLLLIFECVGQIPKVKLGIEVLKERNFDVLEGKRVGLVTNATGVDSQLKSTVDILFEASNVNLVALYGPEHGVRGNYSAGEYVAFYTDAQTRLPVYSLYGKTRKPTPEMLQGIDVLVYDIQDIGCRSYTYISTMGLVMEAAAENNIEVVILDRPNPLGGKRIEGSLVQEGFISFVSQFKIPYLYGLTSGELAYLLNLEKFLAHTCNLKVVQMQGWKREMSFENTGLEWVPTSPHIPHKHSADYYPVSGILGELQVVSIGVGYTLPFQVFAAPWINAGEMAKQMNALQLPGVTFRPISFKPYYNVYAGKEVHGVQVHITDWQKAELSSIQFYFLQVNHRLYPDKNVFQLCDPSRLTMFDKVAGSGRIRQLLEANQFRYASIKALWEAEAESFRQLALKYYLYN
ncbi:DUF1343 domain-containing protein [Rapidithrix thailandica]|uniref:DUF1343 domain-containing protein n=1 Tax=Rapidithrix thailandica TaxID=413964 RepID=A0AAW9S8Y1_9BACT